MTRFGYFLASEEHSPGALTPDMMAQACGPDPRAHLAAIQAYVDAGFDEVYICQVGGDHEGFFRFYAEEVLPALPR
ncbi:hypothetical protein OIE66_23695 [Nonomuraea sp. NBC_01738]|uniref:hypothetical protein n=1 Tax=Nonomuraea sp. NBC_01738 TaxID=2976003 RepID=UPI002E0FBB97|nr:hypothetical protein OIE66_23695 [Nonomuraea sp. NBC_01738]